MKQVLLAAAIATCLMLPILVAQASSLHVDAGVLQTFLFEYDHDAQVDDSEATTVDEPGTASTGDLDDTTTTQDGSDDGTTGPDDTTTDDGSDEGSGDGATDDQTGDATSSDDGSSTDNGDSLDDG